MLKVKCRLLQFLYFICVLNVSSSFKVPTLKKITLPPAIPQSFIITSLIALSFSFPGTHSIALAAPQPEAIERRRVMEQPLGAPEPIKSAVVKLPSGVEYFDAKVGTGNAAEEGKTVQFQWVLRRSNGYFVDASSNYDNEPFIYKVGNTKKVIKGVDEAIRGMKVGGIRRVNIPPNMGINRFIKKYTI